MTVKDTICAIATGMGGSGIGIIRVSGNEAISICDRIFSGKKKIADMETYTAAFGNIVDKSDKEVLKRYEKYLDEFEKMKELALILKNRRLEKIF